MATIFKRGRIWWIGYRDEYGKRANKSLKMTDKKEATKAKKRYEIQELQDDLDGKRRLEMITYPAFIEMYHDRRALKVAPKTVVRDMLALNSLSPLVEGKILNNITPIDIENWRAVLLKKNAASTVNCSLRHIKVAFNYAEEMGYISKTPLKYIRPLREIEKPLRILSKAEALKMLVGLPPAWSDLAKAALYTGARLGELVNMRADDVDIQKQTVTIRNTVNNPTKSRKSRVVPVPVASMPFFKKLKEVAGHGRVLLPTKNGYQWKTTRVSNAFPKRLKKTGIDRCTFHDLRRTYGAWLVMAGSDLVTVQQNLGHSDISITVKHYAGVVMDHRAEQVNLLPELEPPRARIPLQRTSMHSLPSNVSVVRF